MDGTRRANRWASSRFNPHRDEEQELLPCSLTWLPGRSQPEIVLAVHGLLCRCVSSGADSQRQGLWVGRDSKAGIPWMLSFFNEKILKGYEALGRRSNPRVLL